MRSLGAIVAARMRQLSIRVAFVVVIALVTATVATVVTVSRAAAVDAAFDAFWAASGPQQAAEVIPELVNSGVGVTDAFKRLRAGRPYSDTVETGVVTSSYTAHGKEFIYAVNVPHSYDPRRTYQVRFQLHGGVVRQSNFPRTVSIGALAGAEQIYILPTGWADAPWWSSPQIENLATILDTVKRAWSEPGEFDVDGEFLKLTRVRAEPKPYGHTRPIIMNAGPSKTGSPGEQITSLWSGSLSAVGSLA